MMPTARLRSRSHPVRPPSMNTRRPAPSDTRPPREPVAIGAAMIETGSRGGLVSLGAGLLVFMLGGRTGWLRLRNLAVGIIALGVLLWASYSSTLMRNRLELTAQQGNLAGRE